MAAAVGADVLGRIAGDGFAAARRPAREPIGGRNFASADTEGAEIEPRVLGRRREVAVGDAHVLVGTWSWTEK